MKGPQMEASLILIKKDGQRRVFPLAAGITVIGRRPNCDLRVPLLEVSRRHCEVNCHGDLITFRDLGSSNGTLVNGERVQEATLKSGDQIKVGPLIFEIEVKGEASAPPPQTSTLEATPDKPVKPANQISDDDFFADIGLIENSKSGSATEFPAEP